MVRGRNKIEEEKYIQKMINRLFELKSWLWHCYMYNRIQKLKRNADAYIAKRNVRYLIYGREYGEMDW